MDVSFTGINNLYVGKKQYSKLGSYLAQNSEIRQGKNNYTLIKLGADLTDDETGKDLTDFKTTLSKCRPCYQKNCINPQNPNHIDFLVIRKEVKNAIGTLRSSLLQLNNTDILLNEREILPLLTFLAKFTRKIASGKTTSEAQKYYANLANESIQKEAVNIIENVQK